MNARKLPSGSWRARATAIIDGKRVYKSFTADTKEDAEFQAAVWQTKKKRSEKVPDIVRGNRCLYKPQRANFKPSTIAGYISLGEQIKKRFRAVLRV